MNSDILNHSNIDVWFDLIKFSEINLNGLATSYSNFVYKFVFSKFNFFNNNFQLPTVNVVQSMSYWTFSLYLSGFFFIIRTFNQRRTFIDRQLTIFQSEICAFDWNHWNIGKLIFEKQFELKALHQFMCRRSHMIYEAYAMGEYIDACAVCIVVVFDQRNEMIHFVW